LYFSRDKDLRIPSFFKFFKKEGEHKGIHPISLFEGLSTTPSFIVALEESIIEDAYAAENI
jgi:hypothetical protein